MLKETMKNAGVVGAGGAGFPSYAKLADGADTLVVNASECEPLLFTDLFILQRELSSVLAGIGAVLNEQKIPRAIVGVKAHNAKILCWENGQKLDNRVSVHVLPDVYPIGDEIGLIYETTGRVVKPGKLPITAGVIVYNVETLYNVARAMAGNPVTDKWLTLGGDIKNPTVVRVPVGTRVCDLFEKYGVRVDSEHVVLDGGPSMGKVINPESAAVTKTTNGLIVLPRDIPAITAKFTDYRLANARAETACCQCRRCTDMCPRHLLGYPLEPHKMVRSSMSAAETMPIMVLNATLCCGCGICETLACCQGISPKAVINNYKAILAKNKMRYGADADVAVSDEREYRMVPSQRWKEMLGVKKYDAMPGAFREENGFSRFDIYLSQHIGAPSVCTVKVGDYVKRGDMIAAAADGLSLPQYAPADGKVTYVDTKKITVERV